MRDNQMVFGINRVLHVVSGQACGNLRIDS
jgi:hypothetical protein